MKEGAKERRKIFAVAHTSKFTSLLLDMPRLSLPILRLKHGRQHAHLSFPILILNRSILLFSSVSGSSSSSSSLNFLNCSSPRELALACINYLRFHFSLSQPVTLRSQARGYLSEFHRVTCTKESRFSFFFAFSFNELLFPEESLLFL